MDKQALKALLSETGTIQPGHFYRLSGRHTDWYVQCARLFEREQTATQIGDMLAQVGKKWLPQMVLSAAVGGVLPGYLTASRLGLPFAYCEKRDGALILRRGFELPPGARVLVVEDEVSTGQSLREMLEVIRALKAQAVGVACIIDKSGGNLNLGLPVEALYTLEAHHYKPENCPLCVQGLPLQNLR